MNKAGTRFDCFDMKIEETRPAVQDAERVAAVVIEALDHPHR